MKRVLVSMLLVLTLVMSSICSVGAADPAVGTLDWLKAKMLDPNKTVDVPVNIQVKSGGEYANSLTANIGSTVDLKATLDMTNVRTFVTLAQSMLGANYDTFKTYKVSGRFILTATLSGLTAPAGVDTKNIADFSFKAADGSDWTNTLFVENENRTFVDNVLTVTIDIASGKTIQDLENLPASISIEKTGFVTTASPATVTGTITKNADNTKIKTALDEDFASVNYNFTCTNATVNKPSGGGGGSAGPTKNYTLTYESNGGLVFAKESHSKDKVVELDKVPVKVGYVFDGWYLDAALTEEITSIKITEDVTVYAKWIKERHPVPALLNGEDHFAYVIGYPDGTVRPNDNITRAEVTTIFFRLLKDEIRDANLAYENIFNDVNDGDWHNTAISTMAKLGIVNGRFEDMFVPDAFITRAEFTAICARFDETEVVYEGTLNDIAGHWAEDYIKRAAAYGWIEGYSDNTFRPDQFITRAEAMTLINRVLNRIVRSVDDLLNAEMSVWSDNTDVNEWYYTAVQEATHSTEYDRPNSAYKAWTQIIENRDWTKLETTKKAEEPEVTEEPEMVEESEVTEESEMLEETENAEQTESLDVTEA